ncbi:hypothetical protein KY290_024873 [Solanum tuberosum]|uniref:CCHC-type domain-containing protein n=1 Tax=Solanum tuberosum TaxID=4113 RepID=A0ABQ7UT30_SOLTU|nr:hypothetical protein KY290_024873 [Solanum tuberosum]
MGLNGMYTTIRGNILMMNTLPNMAQDFVILSQEEKQRKTNNSAGYKGFRTNYSSSRGGATNSGNTNTKAVFRGNSSTRRSSLFCYYCRKPGHTKDRCYKLQGYPSNPRLQKEKGTVFAVNVCSFDVNMHQIEEEPKLRRKMPLKLSKDQYEQLLNISGSLQVGNGAPNSNN